MKAKKIIIGITIFVGVVLLSIGYYFLMNGVSQVHGSVRVHSNLVSGEIIPAGGGYNDLVQASGYNMKGIHTEKKLLLSTKNKYNKSGLKYSFQAKENKRVLIVLYLQMDQLTGELGQTKELHFLTKTEKWGRTKCDFDISFHKKKGRECVTISVNGLGQKSPKVFEYSVNKIPATIEL
jgi:hypothetical protein